MKLLTEFWAMIKYNHNFFVNAAKKNASIKSVKNVKIYGFIPWPKAWVGNLPYLALYYYPISDLSRYPFAYLDFMYSSALEWLTIKFPSKNK